MPRLNANRGLPPVGAEIGAIVDDWVKFLIESKGFNGVDPLFPGTMVSPGKNLRFQVVGFGREHWSNANPIRNIFRSACEEAGVPYFNPHSLRKTLTRLGQQVCETPEDFKAWSQNLGHDEVLTTFCSYGTVPADRQGEIIRGLKEMSGKARNLDTAQVLAKLSVMLERAGAPLTDDFRATERPIQKTPERD